MPRCNDVNLEWRLVDVERKAREGSECASNLYSIRGDVDCVERTMRELSSVIDELRHELSELQERNQELDNRIEFLENLNEI